MDLWAEGEIGEEMGTGRLCPSQHHTSQEATMATMALSSMALVGGLGSSLGTDFEEKRVRKNSFSFY